MRRPFLYPLLALLLTCAACDNPSAPTNLSVLGHWTSSVADTLDIRMNLSETARAINGAGSWVTPTQAMAFRVSGARVGRSISLLLELGDGPDVNFDGEFLETPSDTLALRGELYGGGHRGTSIIFVRTIADD